MHKAPAKMPTTIAPMGETKPQDGVVATRPATAPEIMPSVVGLPCLRHSMNIQTRAPDAPASCVFTKARAACPLAAKAEPPLKPSQPTQSRPAPIIDKVKLCGIIGSCGKPMRLPTIKQATSPATPELISTTEPPAKSRKPILARKPPPQTQWATGA